MDINAVGKLAALNSHIDLVPVDGSAAPVAPGRPYAITRNQLGRIVLAEDGGGSVLNPLSHA